MLEKTTDRQIKDSLRATRYDVVKHLKSVHNGLPSLPFRRNITFSSNSKAYASELLENLEQMLLLVHIFHHTTIVCHLLWKG